MKITAIGRDELRYIQTRMNDTLKALGDELGVDFQAAGGHYGASAVSKVSIKVRNVGDGRSGEQRSFEELAPLLNLKPHWFNKPFVVRGTIYRIVGTNPTRPKNIISVETANGKRYVCHPDFVRSALEIEEATGRLAA